MNKKTLTLLILLTAFVLPSFANPLTPALLVSQAGKTVCIKNPFEFSNAKVNAEICVSQGTFSHDKYSVKFNGTSILSGIDDQTTNGIKSSYNSLPVSLVCKPQVLPANVTAEQVQEVLPGYPEAKTNALVELMKGSFVPVEISRLCTVSIDDNEVIKTQVIFE